MERIFAHPTALVFMSKIKRKKRFFNSEKALRLLSQKNQTYLRPKKITRQEFDYIQKLW